MKQTLKPISLFLSLVLLLSLLSGCGKEEEFDASSYVQLGLDAIYLGKAEPYAEILNESPETILKNYEAGINAEVDTFIQFFSIRSMTDEMRAEVAVFYKELYSHARYEVKDAQKREDGVYAVEVTVSPIRLFPLITEELKVFFDAFNEDTKNGVYDDLTEEEFETKYAQGILELSTQYLDKIQYASTETVLLTVSQNQKHSYQLDNFQEIDSKIIQYY